MNSGAEWMGVLVLCVAAAFPNRPCMQCSVVLRSTHCDIHTTLLTDHHYSSTDLRVYHVSYSFLLCLMPGSRCFQFCDHAAVQQTRDVILSSTCTIFAPRPFRVCYLCFLERSLEALLWGSRICRCTCVPALLWCRSLPPCVIINLHSTPACIPVHKR
jgi:hypothetical protein